MDHDFSIKEPGKAAPYGIYDMSRNEGFVNLGLSHDTAEFAVESMLRRRQTLGKNTCPDASKLYITGDNGGGNGPRVKLWKKQLQEFANITGLEVHASHFPIGTSICTVSGGRLSWRSSGSSHYSNTMKYRCGLNRVYGKLLLAALCETWVNGGRFSSSEGRGGL